MKHLKTLISAFALLALTFTLTSCSDDDDTYNTPTSPDIFSHQVTADSPALMLKP